VGSWWSFEVALIQLPYKFSTYTVVKGSDSGHCCFEWSILRDGETVCEGWDEAEIRLIAALLNEYEKYKKT
jgi:hypothetical protein